MMEVVVAFTDCHKGSDHMVAGSVLVVKGSFAKPMCERVDTESRLKQIQVKGLHEKSDMSLT